MIVQLALALVAISFPGRDMPEVIQCDLIEINQVLSEGGMPTFKQIIIWEWSPDYRRYHVQLWIVVNDFTEEPRKVGDKYVVEVFGARYESPLCRSTVGRSDPERRNRYVYPERFRKMKNPRVFEGL